MQVSAFEGSWQAGLNLGISRLSPDTDGSAFSLDDEQSSLVNVYVALDVTPIFSAELAFTCLLYTSPSPRDRQKSRMPSSA